MKMKKILLLILVLTLVYVTADAFCASDTPLPKREIPPYQGTTYETNVPDTLDMQDMADMVINAITHSVSPADTSIVYLRFNLNNGKRIEKWQESSLEGELMEALGAMRIITGSNINQNVDQAWRQFFLEKFAKDEITFTGAAGGRLLSWIANNYIYQKDEGWKAVGEKAVLNLLQRARQKDDFCYFPDMPGVYGAPTNKEWMPKGWEATFAGWILQGAVDFYAATGSQKAKELAGKLAQYLKNRAGIFDNQGHFIALHYFTDRPSLHFAHHANALEGMIEYSLATKDMEFATFVKKSYEWARNRGSPLIGYFPEYIKLWPDNRDFEDTETCCIADMIQIAIGLTEMGVGDYWDDVDRFLRNQFSENQLPIARENGERYWWADVGGAFASWALPNEFDAPKNIWTSFTLCCTANAGRALHKAWSKMINYKDGSLKLNLLLNRASAWIDVNSYIPYEGRVDIKIKKPLKELLVRIPEWIQSGSKDVVCDINNTPRQFNWLDRYINLGAVNPNDAVVVKFPISERTQKETIGKVDGKPAEYTFIIRGNNVVDINPQGKTEPQYYRKGKQYRAGTVSWKKVKRFVNER